MTPSPTPSMLMSEPGNACFEHGAHAVEVARHRDVVGRDLLAGAVEEDDVGLADAAPMM